MLIFRAAGSDLHVYRGHSGIEKECVRIVYCTLFDLDRIQYRHTCGHEFIGEVIELGSSYGAASAKGRPALYSNLKVGDKVVSPFTVNCGECQYVLG